MRRRRRRICRSSRRRWRACRPRRTGPRRPPLPVLASVCAAPGWYVLRVLPPVSEITGARDGSVAHDRGRARGQRARGARRQPAALAVELAFRAGGRGDRREEHALRGERRRYSSPARSHTPRASCAEYLYHDALWPSPSSSPPAPLRTLERRVCCVRVSSCVPRAVACALRATLHSPTPATACVSLWQSTTNGSRRARAERSQGRCCAATSGPATVWQRPVV